MCRLSVLAKGNPSTNSGHLNALISRNRFIDNIFNCSLWSRCSSTNTTHTKRTLAKRTFAPLTVDTKCAALE